MPELKLVKSEVGQSGPDSASTTAPDIGNIEPDQASLPRTIDFYAARQQILESRIAFEMRMAAGAEGLSSMPVVGDNLAAVTQAMRIGANLPPRGDGYYPSSHGRFMDDLAAGRVPIVVGVYGPGPDPGGRGRSVVDLQIGESSGLTEDDRQMLATFAYDCLQRFHESLSDFPRTADKIARAAEIIDSVRERGYFGGKHIDYRTPVKSIEFLERGADPARDGGVQVFFGA